MTTQDALVLACAVAKPFEGLRLKAYKCPAGVWTVGWGHTKGAYEGQEITVPEAEALILLDMQEALTGTLKLCPILAKHPVKLAAISDFTFNLGAGNFRASTLRKRLLQEDFDGAIHELKKWVNGGGKRLPGLVRRRYAEAILLQF